MKRIFAAVLCLLMILSVAACGGTATTIDKEATSAEQAKAWIENNMKNNTLLSFGYDGVAYSEHISKWEKTLEETDHGWNLTYTRDGVELAVTVTYNDKHSSLEWVGQWTNNGSGNSKVISDIRILDAAFAIEDAVMTTANTGGMTGETDYQPYSVDLTEESPITEKNTGGRSSQNSWPFFDVTSGDNTYGIMLAVGWSGNWSTNFDYADGTVTVDAGMQNANYYMEAGETLRTPSIVLQFFKGDQDAGHNAWRQLILEKYTPIDVKTGEPMRHAPISLSTWGGQGSAALLQTMKDIKASGQYFEYQWIDAGWYGDHLTVSSADPEWATQLGNWYYNPGFDDVGFSDIKAFHEQNGTGTIIWFEPGRAFVGNALYREHADFFLPLGKDTSDNAAAYLDFGNKEACDYMIDLVIGFLDDMGCYFYRQDYNFDPADAWSRQDMQRDADGNRVGITEINYVTGHYRFLDAILASGRMIDNCASGGRQIDIEMTKRSIPLWRTDYTVSGATGHLSTASGVRSQGANLAWWLPLSGSMTNKVDGINSEYGFRSLMATGANIGQLNDPSLATKMLDEMVYNRDMMLGDYYILQQGLGEGDTNAVNACYEFYLAEEGKGFLAAFRPTNSSEEYTSFVLKGLDAEATYLLENADTDETLERTGEQLMTEGLQLYFPRAKVAHMIYFTKQ